MALDELRDFLELAREYGCRRLKMGNMEVELAERETVEALISSKPEPVHVPSEYEVRNVETRPGVPKHYQDLFGGKAPRFEDLK